ncbi:MAG: hypothetical protein RL127_1509 [Bacteroidota bacterium]
MRAQISLYVESGKQRNKNEPWGCVKKNARDRNWTNELTYFGAEILLGRTAFGLAKSRIKRLA